MAVTPQELLSQLSVIDNLPNASTEGLPNKRIITSADIAGSQTLKDNDIVPGDLLITNTDGTTEIDTAANANRDLQEQLRSLDNLPNASTEGITNPVRIEVGERSVTIDDITASESLQRQGVLPGDKLITNEDGTRELERVYSDGSLAVPEGTKVTAELLQSSLSLRQSGANIGDILVDNDDGSLSIHDMGIQNTMKALEYGFDEAGNLVTNVGRFLDSRFPIALPSFTEGFLSRREVYGDEFMDASPDERIDMLIAQKERALIEEYGYSAVVGNEGSTAQTIGSIGKVLADPTNIIPLTKSPKLAAAISAAIGGGYELSEQLANNQEVDPTAILGYAAGGAVLGGGITLGINRLSVGAARRLARRAQRETDSAVADGLTGTQVTQRVSQRLGATPDYIERAAEKAGLEITLPGSPQLARAALEDAIANDSALTRIVKPAIDNLFRTISTRVGAKSLALKHRLRTFEALTHINTSKALVKVEPFLKGLGKLQRGQARQVYRHLLNQEYKAAKGLLSRYAPHLVGELDNTKSVLDDLGKQLQDAGLDINILDDYFPRQVTDLKGLLRSIGSEQKSFATKAMETYAQGLRRTGGAGALTQDEQAHVYDMLFRGYRVTLDKNGNAKFIYNLGGTDPTSSTFKKSRNIPKLTDEQLKYYADPTESLATYIRRAVNDIETRKMLGEAVENEAAGKLNVNNSIGNLLSKEVSAGRLDNDAVPELMDLFSARLTGGTQSPNGMIAVLRDLGYLGTIANPLSAIRQLGDMANSAWIYGLKNTMVGALGKKYIKMIDIGLDQVSAEMGNPSKFARALNDALGISGFRRIDRLGKETVINTAYRRARGLAKTARGRQKLRRDYGDFYGDEFGSFIDDLNSGDISERVKLFAFNELSEIQPISLSEMPAAFSRNPNGRILYALKSFTLKMWDAAINKTIGEIKKGNTATGVANLARMMTYLAVANAGTEAMRNAARGEELDIETIPDDAMWALLGVYGLNKYTADRYLKNGEITKAGSELILPATPLIDELTSVTADAISGDLDDNLWNYVRPVPVVGDILYNWLGDPPERD